LQETYGGKLNLLARVGDQLQKRAFPVRES
jgi:hypothetical protein